MKSTFVAILAVLVPLLVSCASLPPTSTGISPTGTAAGAGTGIAVSEATKSPALGAAAGVAAYALGSIWDAFTGERQRQFEVQQRADEEAARRQALAAGTTKFNNR